ncbi:hypothetical protein LX15_004717 [Streptoalloteichus tenebrarius]|uniref:Amidase n=1 Tax=Streptoalloteichus tenebrarius (strain ATCC 17920 / DSM 40477 / JCM 4838 / CBS 697.72 / NBRC 16177 / NCIMB 11028 / NRRL B-12390 / A12253. 1 / ISP 5477) TaxID=1933 RepID=A0ABT1HZN7_STRSD|nr:hypothetical protein [Streptoalloteichus tenebrarius]MCP2260997.1 hypothetical protein [Streptoalloteichus tenebrarius]BFE98936.1 hypothetical protein GCM10020241_06120 [Streptoalloteichus tenebrarius]
MSTTALTPPEAARWADRAGLPLPADRHTDVAAVANHIHSVIAVLRELDFGDTPPAAAYRVGEEKHDATV